MIHLICPNPAIDRTVLIHSIENNLPNRPTEIREYPGGKSFNVAYSLNYESEVNMMIHTMSGGNYGKQLHELALQKKLTINNTPISENTRICTILVDTQHNSVIPVYEKGFSLDKDTLTKFTTNIVTNIQSGDTVVFSGSLMQGMPEDYIAQFSEQMTQEKIHVKLCVDTSGEALVHAYTCDPFLIKINDEEILDLFPDANLNSITDYVTLLESTIKPEINNFIITLGKDGVIGRINNQIYHGFADAVTAKNPIASGDFFLGRLIKQISQNVEPVDVLTDAILFSTCNVLNWFPEVTAEQLTQIRPTITVKQLG